MATNLDVDLVALDDLVRLGNFRSKREAVDAAVREAVAFRRQLRSLDVLGTIEFQSLSVGPGPISGSPE
jgi:Arc/MetJ-type ribon-helix-helix transcriptional regulator